MKRLKHIRGLIYFITFILFFNLNIKSVFAGVSTSSRISGENRFETSVQISQNGWKDGSEYAVIVQGYNQADALCAVPLAKKIGAPIILTSKEHLNEECIEELKRLKVKHVFIIGGQGAISAEVEKDLMKIIKDVERISGETRYSTALKVAEKLGSVDSIFITSSNGYADSLSIASIAGEKSAPILFSEKGSLDSNVKKYVEDKNIRQIYVIGSNNVISEDIENSLKGRNIKRIYGKNRFETNLLAIKNFADELNFQNIYVTVGDGPQKDDFADSLSISALAAQKSAPVLLVYKDIDSRVEEFIKSNITSKTKITATGGETSVPTSILDKLTVKSKEININSNNEFLGDKVKVNDIEDDLSVNADNVTLQNLNIKGALTLNPGKNGSVDLKNVNAKIIEVKSGGEHSIRFENVRANLLLISSKEKVRVEIKGNTNINITEVNSSSLLEALEGSFGKIVISPKTTETIALKGKFNLVEIKKDSKLEIQKGTKVSKIIAGSKANINIDKEAVVEVIEKTNNDVIVEGIANKEVDSKIPVQPGAIMVGGGGAGGGGIPSTGDEGNFTLRITRNHGATKLKELKVNIRSGKTAEEYLMENADVVEKQGSGFINGIDGLENLTIDELSTSQRERGIMGVDWFVYLNGKKTDRGVNAIYPEKGNIISFDYHEWNWREMVPSDYKDGMPLTAEVPSEVNSGDTFIVKVSCILRPVAKAKVSVNGRTFYTNIEGEAKVNVLGSGNYKVKIEKDGGIIEQDINVIGNSSSGGNTGTNPGGNTNGGNNGSNGNNNETREIALSKDKITVVIRKIENDRLSISVKDTENSNGMFTIKLYDKENTIKYINQGDLNNGCVEFIAKLEKGTYLCTINGSKIRNLDMGEFELR